VPPLGVLALVLVAALTGSVEFDVVGVCLTADGALLLLELANLVVGGAEVGVEYLDFLILASLLDLQHL
jgi:hypothetical protein